MPKSSRVSPPVVRLTGLRSMSKDEFLREFLPFLFAACMMNLPELQQLQRLTQEKAGHGNSPPAGDEPAGHAPGLRHTTGFNVLLSDLVTQRFVQMMGRKVPGVALVRVQRGGRRARTTNGELGAKRDTRRRQDFALANQRLLKQLAMLGPVDEECEAALKLGPDGLLALEQEHGGAEACDDADYSHYALIDYVWTSINNMLRKASGGIPLFITWLSRVQSSSDTMASAFPGRKALQMSSADWDAAVADAMELLATGGNGSLGPDKPTSASADSYFDASDMDQVALASLSGESSVCDCGVICDCGMDIILGLQDPPVQEPARAASAGLPSVESPPWSLIGDPTPLSLAPTAAAARPPGPLKRVRTADGALADADEPERGPRVKRTCSA